MMKLKTRSREMIENTDYLHRYAIQRNSSTKDQRRLAKTADRRHHSNQYAHSCGRLPLQQRGKPQQHSAHKTLRKQSRMPMGERKGTWSKTFIGLKLRKRLQRYFLLLALASYSLRSSYLRGEVRRFKVYVGKGNNSKLVKSIFALRFWWGCTDNVGEANLVWTQRAKKKVFKSIGELEIELPEINQEQNQLAKRRAKPKRRERGTDYDEDLEGILCEKDKQMLRNECRRDSYMQDLRAFIKRSKAEKREQLLLTHNHLEHHRLLTNKKNLYYNLKSYCELHNDDLFNYVPLTFHLTGNQDQYNQIAKHEEETEGRKEREKLLWIVKPGQNSNRGCGIEICRRVQQIRKHIEREKEKHPTRTFIVQRYINPFLFHRRKFDIRCFALVTATPFVSAYFYPIGYIRTSSYQFSMKNCTNKYIHLTNDAVQKKAIEYSKYEVGNKVRFEQFQAYLDLLAFSKDSSPEKRVNFFTDILPTIKDLVGLSIRAANNFSSSKKQHSFEILGYDFMIDEQMKPWLIEINTNPCLQTNCQILFDIIPAMLENAVKIAVDTVFKPPKMEEWSMKELISSSDRLLETNRFELVYSELHASE